MEGRLHGRVVVITGGCGDIGRASAAAFAQEGARGILVDVLSPDEARAALGASEADAFVYIRCDVLDRASVHGVIATVEREYGGPDVAIANAGIMRSTPALAVSQESGRRRWT
jgi:NAD(P)-dependent dehydrogenase (short-subunit alcohol dehydrogenase family)